MTAASQEWIMDPDDRSCEDNFDTQTYNICMLVKKHFAKYEKERKAFARDLAEQLNTPKKPNLKK
jgi:hypothetical protein